MGLDISIYKVIELGDKNSQDVDDFYLLSEMPELSIFKTYSFKRLNDYYDFELVFEKMGLNINDYKCVEQSFTDDELSYFVFIKNNDNERVAFTDPPIVSRLEDVIMFEEVGYQRKGVNKLFYLHNIWDHPPIVEKHILLEHWIKYFSFNFDDVNESFGSSTEYSLTNNEMKENFKRNIIDKFIENETFVVYH